MSKFRFKDVTAVKIKFSAKCSFTVLLFNVALMLNNIVIPENVRFFAKNFDRLTSEKNI